MSDLPDRQLVDWLQSGPDRGPQHGLDRALAAAHRTTQRPRWSRPVAWITGRPAAGRVDAQPGAQGSLLRFAVVMALVAVSVTAGLGLIARNAEIGGPSQPTLAPPPASPSPSPTPSPSPSITPRPGDGTAPPDWPTNAPLVPATPLPDPSGKPLPSAYVGRVYDTAPKEVQGMQGLLMTLRAADDPQCTAMFGGRSTCFTVLWTPNYPKHINDKAVRGPARIVDGNLVLGFALVPEDPGCEGTSSTYRISPDGWTLDGIDVPPCSILGFTRH
jgi:hypothetical protein